MFKGKTLSVKERQALGGKDAKALRKKVGDQFPQLNGERVGGRACQTRDASCKL